MSRAELREQMIAEMKRNRPQDAEYAERIVDHLLTLPVMEDEQNIITLIDYYRKEVKERRERGILT